MGLIFGRPYVVFGEPRKSISTIHLPFINKREKVVANIYMGSSPFFELSNKTVRNMLAQQLSLKTKSEGEDVLVALERSLVLFAKDILKQNAVKIIRGSKAPPGSYYYYAKIVWQNGTPPGFVDGKAILGESWFV